MKEKTVVEQDQGEKQEKQPEQPRGKGKSSEAQEKALSPHNSYWPLALAVALMVALIGVIVHPLLFGFGILLVVVAVIGWGLERH